MIDIQKFSWPEMVNDSKGVTSPTKFIGVLASMVAIFCFFICALSTIVILWFTSKSATDYGPVLAAFQSIIMQSLAMLTIGTALIATNRLSKDKEIKVD